MRLDQLLVERDLFASRSRARDAIVRGTVKVDGAVVTKPGAVIGAAAIILVDDPASAYVSRAALKLIAGLDHFDIPVAGRAALDIGASTGGFTQVLIERGAAHVTAVDVGHGQLHERLRGDPRITNLESLNARELTRDHLGGLKADLVVSDVSFISLKLALPPALDLAEPGSHCVLLVKPQFEAGREAIGKGGILRDPKDGERVADDLRKWLDAMPDWNALGLCPSPIEGGDGNREYLLAGLKRKV
ncbi:23S rRNA (cytidine1920-2'-O)/16S rRNA (cytidine1409-2'-O)-methyltransferase [Phyllobacterium sp. CL33Tsu]|uniref:TlyA family RNA methyltransferase n=1 Tax=Phyllobacterium sp. CL33Tsu TaxID=1798191 RepID=UPI0008E66E80|nr:TlyA family RNA methyltransferase [Phyllobacterium sp. CL33Tsu]SFI55161.1 23S rRNA (cytidine1920-2'-O)/16S rRNA (cytidine1409-2'-O)-methyltransferase [Phyllobacterium sp. CL33Tsu]